MIIFINSLDNYRSHHKLAELKKKFEEKVQSGGASVVIMEGENFDINSLREKILSPALFSKQRMIVVKNLLQTNLGKKIQEQLIELLGKDEENVVVFVENFSDQKSQKKISSQPLYSFLNKQKFVQNYDQLQGKRLEKWLVSRALELGAKLSPLLAAQLVSAVGDNMWRLENELQKLILYAADKDITQSDIGELVKTKFDNDIWQFTDALARRNSKLAIKIFNNQLLTGTTTSELFYKIVWQFRVLLLVKTAQQEKNITSRQIAGLTGLHPFVAQKALPLAKNFQLKELIIWQLHLGNIDRQIKSNLIPAEVLLDLFMVNLSK